MKTNKIGVGDFALCDKGYLGVILWETKSIIKRTGKIHTIYHGVNLTPGKKWGLNWQSKNPKKITKTHLKKIMDGKVVFYE